MLRGCGAQFSDTDVEVLGTNELLVYQLYGAVSSLDLTICSIIIFMCCNANPYIQNGFHRVTCSILYMCVMLHIIIVHSRMFKSNEYETESNFHTLFQDHSDIFL